MNRIYWLQILNPTRQNKHLSNHFILKVENKFMVFTSNPITDLKCHYIGTPNIEGNPKPQFLAEKIHTVDPVNHWIQHSERGAVFLKNNSIQLQPFVEKLIELNNG